MKPISESILVPNEATHHPRVSIEVFTDFELTVLKKKAKASNHKFNFQNYIPDNLNEPKFHLQKKLLMINR